MGADWLGDYTKAAFLIKVEHTNLKNSVRLLDSLEYFIRKASLILEKSPKFLSATYV